MELNACLSVCVCVRHEWLLCVWFPLGWKIISHLLRPVNFTPESEAVIAVPFSNYSAIQKMLKVTSMLPLQPLGRTWKLLSMLFLTNSLLGLSVYIYCPYIEHLWMWNWVQIVLWKQRQTTKKTYSSLPKSRFFMSDMGLCLIPPLQSLSGYFLPINLFSSQKAEKQNTHVKASVILNPTQTVSQHVLSSKTWHSHIA